MVKFSFLESHNASKIHRRLVETSGKETLGESMGRESCKSLKNGDWSVEAQRRNDQNVGIRRTRAHCHNRGSFSRKQSLQFDASSVGNVCCIFLVEF